MKKVNLYFGIAALALSLTACSEDKMGTEPNQPAQKGDEVNFGVAFESDSRTIYGDETDNAFPIYWVNGDEINVVSPQCAAGRNTAIYTVAVDGPTQNYASSLTHTGANGVQWGDAATADFYAFWPANQLNGNPSLSINGTSVKADVNIPGAQRAIVPTNYLTATSFTAQPVMRNSIMYAQTMNQANTTQVVDLAFKPMSTVIEFELTGPTEAVSTQELTIQGVSLVAPEGTHIAGDFVVNFGAGNPTISETDEATNTEQITVSPVDGSNNYATLKSGQSMKIMMFLMPLENLVLNSNWEVIVTTSAGTFHKNIKYDNPGKTGEVNGALKAGQVHKIKLPALDTTQSNWVLEPASWISSIPDNVYLSELTFPGAWYAWDANNTRSTGAIGNHSPEGYQNQNIGQMFLKGVRAFQFEVRLGNNSSAASSTVVISGTGRNIRSNYYGDAVSFAEPLDSIAGILAAHPQEYAMVQINWVDGGSRSVNATWQQQFMNRLQALLYGLSSTTKDRIYSSEITPTTTVNEVRGKMILVMGVPNADINQSPAGNINALFAYMNNDWDATAQESSLISKMFWKQQIPSTDLANATLGTEGLYLNYTKANRSFKEGITKYNSWGRPDGTYTTNDDNLPTIEDRKLSIETMINYSREVYEKSQHNLWFSIGAGGVYAGNRTADAVEGSPSEIASELNTYILGFVNQKLNKTLVPSPLGMVFCNQITATGDVGQNLVDAIIQLNNSFYLNRDESGTVQNGPQKIKTASSFKVSQTDAWTME